MRCDPACGSGDTCDVDGSCIEFPVGQDRARISLAMTSDFSREADQQATLRIRETDSATSELAIINVILEDDDQRAFEATLPANTVAFAASQAKGPPYRMDAFYRHVRRETGIDGSLEDIFLSLTGKGST